MRNFLIACVAVALGGCTNTDSTIGPFDDDESSLVIAGDGSREIAKSLAIALAKENVSSSLRDGLRASPYNEHKLVLNEWIGSPQGEILLREAARAMDVNADDFMSKLAQLPEMDLYLPFRKHRLSWRGSPNVMVAVLTDPEAQVVTAYGGDGEGVSLNAAEARASSRPLLIAHQSEPKSHRRDIRAVGGETVQDIDELEDTEVLVVLGSSPNSRRLAPHQICDGEDCSGGGGGSLPLQLVVDDFIVYEHFEGPFMGSMEIEILYITSANELFKIRKTGVEADQLYVLNKGIYSDNPLQIIFSMRETDWPSSDDFIGEGQIQESSIVCTDIASPSDCNALVSHTF